MLSSKLRLLLLVLLCLPLLASCSMLFPANTAGTTVDADGDGLIEIHSIEHLNNMRHNVADTSYKTARLDTGNTTGCPKPAGCKGYELMKDLDFTQASSYANGRVNAICQKPADHDPSTAGWQHNPDARSSASWTPIGQELNPFTSTFEGNGHQIRNLYSHVVTTGRNESVGLFGFAGDPRTAATIRNIELTAVTTVATGSAYNPLISGLVGDLTYGSIEHASVSGSVSYSGSGSHAIIGGLLGGIMI